MDHQETLSDLMNEAQPPAEPIEGPADQVAEFQHLLDQFVDLEQRKRDSEGELETITDQIKAIEPQLREHFATLGLQNCRCRGLTVYIKTDRYVSKKSEKDGVTTELLVERLRSLGLGYMVSEGYSASSLKAKVVEWQAEGVEVPPELAGLLNIGESKKLATRK